MFGKLKFKNRIDLIIGLLAVFLLVLGTNRIDQHHFDTAQNAVSSIYDNRVLAQDYVYKMNNLIYEKKLNYLQGTNRSTISNSNKELKTLIDLFSSTELTTKESRVFQNMQESYEKNSSVEQAYFKTVEKSLSKSNNEMNSIMEHLTDFQIELNNLALIQVSESRNILGIAQKSLDSNRLLSNMEIWFLLVIGIVVQFLIFSRSSKTFAAEVQK
jgi:hypothetical protein